MDYADGRLLYLVLLLLLLVVFLRGSGSLPRFSEAVRTLAIWGTVLAGVALVYALLAA